MLGCRLERMTRISLIMRSFFGCLSRSICLMATARFVPTWYAVYTPPDALQMNSSQLVRYQTREFGGVYPCPILTKLRYNRVGSASVQISRKRLTMSTSLTLSFFSLRLGVATP